MTERKKARNMLPRVAGHLGKTVQTAPSGKNEQAQISVNVF